MNSEKSAPMSNNDLQGTHLPATRNSKMSVLLLLITAVAILTISYSLLANTELGADNSTPTSEIIVEAENAPSENLSQTKIIEALTWTVRVRLEDLKLNHRLRAEASSKGAIRIYGNVSASDKPRWKRFLRWYESKQNFPPLIRDINLTAIEDNLPAIKSVWLDDKPTVFFQDGTMGNIGAYIKGGWKIIDITSLNVTIKRDGAMVSLNYFSDR